MYKICVCRAKKSLFGLDYLEDTRSNNFLGMLVMTTAATITMTIVAAVAV